MHRHLHRLLAAAAVLMALTLPGCGAADPSAQVPPLQSTEASVADLHPACGCEDPPRLPVTGFGFGVDCDEALMNAFSNAIANISSVCPHGACAAEELADSCDTTPTGSFFAQSNLRVSCRGPACLY